MEQELLDGKIRWIHFLTRHVNVSSIREALRNEAYLERKHPSGDSYLLKLLLRFA